MSDLIQTSRGDMLILAEDVYRSWHWCPILNNTTHADVASNTRQKRALDRLSSGFIKRSDILEGVDKRHLDRLSSGFIKRNSDEALEDALLKLEYYLAQTIVNKLRTKGEEGLTESKRAFDRMGMGLWKKRSGDTMYGEISKRRFDRMGMGLIKRVPSGADDNIEQEKRRFDRLGSGFIKKSSAGTDKRYFDRLGTGLLKRQSNEKRYMDRLGAGLL